jgi:hypothetical protein
VAEEFGDIGGVHDFGVVVKDRCALICPFLMTTLPAMVSPLCADTAGRPAEGGRHSHLEWMNIMLPRT